MSLDLGITQNWYTNQGGRIKHEVHVSHLLFITHNINTNRLCSKNQNQSMSHLRFLTQEEITNRISPKTNRECMNQHESLNLSGMYESGKEIFFMGYLRITATVYTKPIL